MTTTLTKADPLSYEVTFSSYPGEAFGSSSYYQNDPVRYIKDIITDFNIQLKPNDVCQLVATYKIKSGRKTELQRRIVHEWKYSELSR